MKRIFVAALLLLSCARQTVAPPQAVRDRLDDRAALFNSIDGDLINARLAELSRRGRLEAYMRVIETTRGQPIEEYAWDMAKEKGLTSLRGVVFVLAVKDKRVRITYTDALETDLTSAFCQRIVDEVFLPEFRAGEFARGMTEGINRMIARFPAR